MRVSLHVDFHQHTTESDGLLEPAALLRAIASAGLDYFSITDHDTLAAYQHVDGMGEQLARRAVRGIEVSTQTGGREIHILGYNIPLDGGALRELLRDRAQMRRSRAERVVEKLSQLGVSIAMADVERHAKGVMIGRPHIARALVELGQSSDVENAFDLYLGSSGSAYVALTTLTSAQAIGAIRESGGVAILAHPTRNNAEALISDLRKEGLQGIEAFSPSHTPHDAQRFRALARRLGLVMTAGSDFHMATESNPRPGVEVEEEDLSGFLALIT